MKLGIEHNLTEDQLIKAITAMAEDSNVGHRVIEALQKSKAIDDTPKVPRHPALREMFYQLQAEYGEAITDLCERVIPDILRGAELIKAQEARPLTKEEIQRIQQAISDRFEFIAAQVQDVDYIPPQELIDRWKLQGLIGQDITPESFALVTSAEQHIIRNAFLFGRLHQAMEQGRSFDEMMQLAIALPLKKPDLHAIAVAEAQAANYITAMGDHLGTEAGKLIATRNRAIIQRMVADYHRGELRAKVLDEAEKREQGMDIPLRFVDDWRGFSSELYHAMEDKARDWDRVAFYEINDAAGMGKGFQLLEEFGPAQKVYKMPLPTACAQCRYLYLKPDGTPRVYPLEQMLGFGNNVGRKPMPVVGGEVVNPVRPDEQETLKPVCGQVHPWCMCGGPFLVTGAEPWYTGE